VRNWKSIVTFCLATAALPEYKRFAACSTVTVGARVTTEARRNAIPAVGSRAIVTKSVGRGVVFVVGVLPRDSVQQCTYALAPVNLLIIAAKLDQGYKRRLNDNPTMESTMTPLQAATTLGMAFAMLPA
jgi:hypothetical protein